VFLLESAHPHDTLPFPSLLPVIVTIQHMLDNVHLL
jgi:hypothetical protein